MIMKKICLALLLLMPLMTELQASGGGGGGGGGGSFSGGGGSSGSKKKTVNTKVFEKGKAVFEGRFTPVRSNSRSLRNSQARNLIQMRKKLATKSEREAAKIDVNKWAGRLSANDYRSLKYYIDVRYLRSERYSRR